MNEDLDITTVYKAYCPEHKREFEITGASVATTFPDLNGPPVSKVFGLYLGCGHRVDPPTDH